MQGYENTYCAPNPHLLVKRLFFYDYIIVIHLSNEKKCLTKSHRAVGNFKCTPCRKMYCKAGVCSSKNFKRKYFLAPVLYHSDYEVMTIGVVITPRERMSQHARFWYLCHQRRPRLACAAMVLVVRTHKIWKNLNA